MTNIENPIKLKADLQEAALVLQSMRHAILAKAVLQAINLIEAHERHIGNPFEGPMGEPPRLSEAEKAIFRREFKL